MLVKGQKIGEPYVEAAHDFLVRGWDKLQDWIQKEQPNLFLQQRLSPAAIDWEKNHQDIEYLWIRDPRLALLEKILESETNNWLNGIETTFVQKSKDRRQDELEETKRQLRISEERQKKAEDNQKEAKKQTGNALTNASEAFWTSDQQLEALLSALKSIKILINSQDKLSLDRATFALQQAVYGVQEKNRLEGHSAGVTSVSISPDGKLIASGSYDGNIKLWKPDGGVIKTLKLHNGTWVTSVNFSHDGQKIVSTSYNGAIILWNRDGSL